MTTPTLDYLTEAHRRGAIQRSRIENCRCDVCTARAAARAVYATPDREGLING